MGDAGVAADICAQGDQGVELPPLAVVQAEHVIKEPCVQQRGKLQHRERSAQCMPAWSCDKALPSGSPWMT